MDLSRRFQGHVNCTLPITFSVVVYDETTDLAVEDYLAYVNIRYCVDIHNKIHYSRVHKLVASSVVLIHKFS